MSSFVHLHGHSKGSLLDGLPEHKNLFEAVKNKGMDAVAITEHGQLYFVYQAYKLAKKMGVKFIPGCEVYVVPDRFSRGEKEKPWHLVLLAKNKDGFHNLVKLVSLANLEGFYYKPRIDRELLERNRSGIICLSGCMASEISCHILNDDINKAKEVAKYYQNLFQDDYYLEIQNHFLPEDKKLIKGHVEIAKELGISLVATNDYHYLEKEEAEIHEILLAIQTGKTLDDKTRIKLETPEYYLKTPEEMKHLFREYPEAIVNTQIIAGKCDVEFNFSATHYPVYQPPNNATPEEYLQRLAVAGMIKRYGKNVSENIKKQLAYELKVITSMGYASYFLVVWDFIKYARSKGILVGPGRGSAAGSLVSYCLGITNLCPIRYKLIFERFLNPERVSMPDIDIDFDDERRNEVFQYLVQKYGKDMVAQISTFGTMAAKLAIKDVCRVMGITAKEANDLSSLIPFGASIKEALDSNIELQSKYANSPQIHKVIDTAMKIEGLARHVSVHAAGAVIGDAPLVNYLPLRQAEGVPVTQVEKEEVEELGLLKMDLLGLRTLSVIRRTLEIIEEKYGLTIKPDDIPLEDEETYKMLATGNCTGVFQLEGNMPPYVKALKPNCIEDVIAICALYRPGPLNYRIKIGGKEINMVDLYILRKHEELPIEYPHPNLKPVLKDTYGVIVYQEQVMEIARLMAGYSFGQADELRRAMGKKKPEEMAKHRKYFIFGRPEKNVPGALAKGYNEEEANRVFDMMEKFAEYGFNRAHSAAYAILSVQTAYLKCHYPAEYTAAILTSCLNNNDKLKSYLYEFKQIGIKINPPNVNTSSNVFTAGEGQSVIFGLNGIKNVGSVLASQIILERQNKGLYKDMADFVYRNINHLTSQSLKSLIMAGALDCFEGNRAQKLAAVDKILAWAHEKQKSAGQLLLFGELPSPKLPNIPESKDILHNEYRVLGVYVSKNPLEEYMWIFRKAGAIILTDETDEETEFDNRPDVITGGVIVEVTPPTGKTAKIKIEDFTGSSVTVYLNVHAYSKYQGLLELHKVILVEGKANGRKMFGITKILDANEIVKGIVIKINEKEDFYLEKIEDITSRYPGPLPVKIVFPKKKESLLLKCNVNIGFGLELNEHKIPFEVILRTQER